MYYESFNEIYRLLNAFSLFSTQERCLKIIKLSDIIIDLMQSKLVIDILKNKLKNDVERCQVSIPGLFFFEDKISNTKKHLEILDSLSAHLSELGNIDETFEKMDKINKFLLYIKKHKERI